MIACYGVMWGIGKARGASEHVAREISGLTDWIRIRYVVISMQSEYNVDSQPSLKSTVSSLLPIINHSNCT